ncbi:hypothetical protein E4U43_003806 [Claviceps pusilla]|uniref:Myb-like domain-containing protein n=1 Tax=Claviceps pusilla TaxID=123648 RepID=A0A9P7SXB7_9HYPO|nr:hypothetical protein E4U43_003806 [Claviceps pusilla]
MSPASAADGAGRKPQAWTEQAKLQLLWRINTQLRDGGRPIDWNKINMPGRTPKSLQNTWFSIKKVMAELDEKEKTDGVGMDNDSVSGSPAKSATPRKRLPSKNKAMALKEAQDDDDEDDKTALLKRKSEIEAGGKGKKLKGTIKNDPDHEDDEKLDILEDYVEEM